jgi:hypothetical protein
MIPRIVHILIFLFVFVVTVSAQQDAEKQRVQQVIIEMFEAFSTADLQKMEQAVTPDINILEQGEVWTMDTIIVYLKKPRPTDFKRTNAFDFFKTEVKADHAFVCYYNMATIHADNKDRNLKWLESAVLVKRANKWRIKMLHSTRVRVN